jgi:hypothetical protein
MNTTFLLLGVGVAGGVGYHFYLWNIDVNMRMRGNWIDVLQQDVGLA